MAENTSISWARHTFNGWIGCTKVSPACKFCYAERDWDKRFHRVTWGPKGKRSLTGDDNWNKPLAWNRAAAAAGERHSVFCNSLSDWMDDHPSIKPEWHARLWQLILATPHLDWLPLTKRPENWEQFIPFFDMPVANVRLGISIEDQERADICAPYLKAAHDAGWNTFVSYGPACGPVDWDALLPHIGWLVAEGESGPQARPSHPQWFRQARDACARHGVPYHHKQNGEWIAYDDAINLDGVNLHTVQTCGFGAGDPHGNPQMARVGIAKAGRMLDGVLHDAFP